MQTIDCVVAGAGVVGLAIARALAVSGREVVIAVDIGLGQGAARVWTCDLTHAYIDINGSYRS